MRWSFALVAALCVASVACEGGAAGEGGGAPVGPAAEVPGPARGDAPEAWASREGCEAALRLRAGVRSVAPRIGTWNVRWFPDGGPSPAAPGEGTDVAWLACAIATLDVGVLAMQELTQGPRGRAALAELLAALGAHTGSRWAARVDDCPEDGRQHVGLIWDESVVEVGHVRTLGALNPAGGACAGRLRPGLGAYLRFRAGPDLHVVVLHADSGTTTRDHRNRGVTAEALRLELGRLGGVERDDDVLVLGDFNTMGCADCPGGVAAGAEIAALEATLATAGLPLRRLPPSRPCTEYHRGRGALLDHVFAGVAMAEIAGSRAEVGGPCGVLSCAPPPPGAAYGRRLGDHCPVVVALGAMDADP